MGDHGHAFWQPPPPLASSSSGVPFPYPYHAPGYGQEPLFAYGYENGLAPIRDRDPPGQHNSIHPAVQSSLWRGSFPSPTSSYHELRGEGSVGSSGRSPSTESPPLPQPPAYHHSRSYSYGGPGSTHGDMSSTSRELQRPLVPSSAPAEPRVVGSGKVKPFIAKLMALLADGEVNQDVLTWDQSGTSFVLSHANPRLLAEVLPKAFAHQNLQSFTRQLNVYDFKRLPLPDLLDKLDLGPSANTIEYSGWYHPYFLRDDNSRLSLMTPRPSRARAQKKLDKAERLEAQRRKSYGPG